MNAEKFKTLARATTSVLAVEVGHLQLALADELFKKSLIAGLARGQIDIEEVHHLQETVPALRTYAELHTSSLTSPEFLRANAALEALLRADDTPNLVTAAALVKHEKFKNLEAHARRAVRSQWRDAIQTLLR